MADREGRLEDRPARIKFEVFPGDKVNVENLLCGLSSAGLILRYVVQGKQLIAIPTFKDHQHTHPHEAQSRLPAPPSVITCNDISGKTVANTDVITCRDMSLHVIPTSTSLEVEVDLRSDPDLFSGSDQSPDPNRRSPIEHREAAKPRVPAATRLPEDFQLTPEREAKAREIGIANPIWEFEKFADYWRGVPGTKATKTDWEATWRNWCKKTVEDGKGGGPNVPAQRALLNGGAHRGNGPPPLESNEFWAGNAGMSNLVRRAGIRPGGGSESTGNSKVVDLGESKLDPAAGRRHDDSAMGPDTRRRSNTG